ncbi:MAG: ASCH domain-containing protein [Pseudomonadota bacterium]
MTNGADWQTLPTTTFGDDPALADRLAALVVARVKTATCWAAQHGSDTAIGDQRVCLGGDGTPVAILETTTIVTVSFSDVTQDMATLEGEGDLSLDYWRHVHEAFFKRDGTWSPDMDVVFETFKLVDILDLHFAAEARGQVDAERAAAYAAGYKALESKP